MLYASLKSWSKTVFNVHLSAINPEFKELVSYCISFDVPDNNLLIVIVFKVSRKKKKKKIKNKIKNDRHERFSKLSVFNVHLYALLLH